MNALQVILGLNSKIHAEHLHLRNAMHISEATITGHIYTNSEQGERLSQEQYEGRVNVELIRNCKIHLGYGLVGRFEYELTQELQGSTKEKASYALNTHHIGLNITASDFVSYLSEALDIDVHYFERLMAHTLITELLLKSPSATIEDIKFNNFSISCLSSTEDSSFFINSRDVLSVVALIKNICGKPFNDSYIKDALADIKNLNAFDDKHSVKEILGIKITAQKNGKLKFTLDQNSAEIFKDKVQPHLGLYHRCFVDTNFS